MADDFEKHQSGLSSPATTATELTPSDGADLPTAARAIYVGVGGDLRIIPVGQIGAVTFAGVPGGSILPVRTKRVLATGTTAGSMLALR